MDNEPETIKQDGGIYRIESSGESHTVKYAQDGTFTFVGRVKGYKAAREIVRWHARQRVLGKLPK